MAVCDFPDSSHTPPPGLTLFAARGSKDIAYQEKGRTPRQERPGQPGQPRARSSLVNLVNPAPGASYRVSPLDGVCGAVWSYEVKRGSGSGTWHPHLHMIALAAEAPDQRHLSAEWHNITGDSFIVDVRPIDESDTAAGFCEVFKYAVKFADQPPADTVHAWLTLGGKRLLGSSGCFRGVEVPESLLDDPEGLQELPYFTLFYRYLVGAGYSLLARG